MDTPRSRNAFSRGTSWKHVLTWWWFATTRPVATEATLHKFGMAAFEFVLDSPSTLEISLRTSLRPDEPPTVYSLECEADSEYAFRVTSVSRSYAFRSHEWITFHIDPPLPCCSARRHPVPKLRRRPLPTVPEEENTNPNFTDSDLTVILPQVECGGVADL